MGLRVLIVDDSENIRGLLRTSLLSLGHVVVGEGEDGTEGVELYQRLKPDLVTMDIVMPMMDGLTALEEIKKADPKARVVMVSSAASRGNLARAKQSGALKFFVKPISEEELKSLLEEVETALKKERAA